MRSWLNTRAMLIPTVAVLCYQSLFASETKLITSTSKGYESLPIIQSISSFFGTHSGSLVISPEGKLFARKEGIYIEGAAGLETTGKDGYREVFASSSQGTGNYSVFHSRLNEKEKNKKESEAMLIENNQAFGKISCLGPDTDNCVAVNNLICSDLKIQLGNLDPEQLRAKYSNSKWSYESKVSEVYNRNLGNSLVTKLAEKLDPILKKGSGRNLLDTTHIEMESLRSEKLMSGFLLAKCSDWLSKTDHEKPSPSSSEKPASIPPPTKPPVQMMDGTGKN